MIEVKQAIEIALRGASTLLDLKPENVEEIERETYRDREVWSITLSFPRDLGPSAIIGFRKNYKRFLIDIETGELVAVKLREIVST